jgi:hypothetical protein
MSLSAVGDLGWRLQRDVLAADGVASQAAAAAAATPAAATPVAADSSNAADVTYRSGDSALAQNIQLFMQVLYEALSNASTAPGTSAGSVERGAALYSPSSSPTYSRGSVASYRTSGYSQGPKGLSGKIQSLISTLNEPQQSPDTSVSSLQSAFGRLLGDLEASGAPVASSVPGSSGRLTLRSWLLGLQQNLQQPAATSFSAVGNLVDVTV